MLSAIIAIISLVLIIIIGIVLYYRDEKNKKDTQDKMQGLVDQINDSQYYEYKFDKKQDQNIKNIDQNVTQVHDSVVKLQNNVSYVQKNALFKDDAKKHLDSDKSTIGVLKTNKTTVANNTDKNNVVIEGGRTLDGNNEGWSAINFNGYFNNGEKRIDANKSRWRMVADQRNGSDTMIFDQLDKKNNLHQYLMMADGTVEFNDNKLRLSNKWTGFPDTANDRSEISNDTNGFKELMIVGNKSGGKERRVGVWDTLNVHGTLNTTGNTKSSYFNVCGQGEDCNKGIGIFKNNNDGADPNETANNYQGGLESWYGIGFRNKIDGHTRFMHDTRTGNTNISGQLTTPKGINVTGNNPGPLIEKRYNFTNHGDRYGVGQFPSGQMKIYTATNYPGNVSMSLANSDGSFKDIITVNPNTSINMNGHTIFKNQITTPDGHIIHNEGRQHISTGDKLFLLPKQGVTIGKEWGGSGDLKIEGDLSINGATNISNKWRLGNTGDDWLRLNTPGKASVNSFYGGLAAGKLWSSQGGLAGSDIRMKDNVNDISQNDVNKLLQLNPKSYNYTEDHDKRQRFGFIAQEVEKLYPDMVVEGANGMKSLNYDDIIPLAVENIKNINKKINNLTPNNKQVCIDGLCLTKDDIIKIKNM